MNRLYLIALLLIFFSNFNIFSQQETDLTLSRAIDLSVANNTSYKILKESAKEAEENVNITWGMLWPALSSDASVTKMGSDPESSMRPEKQYSINIVNAQISVNPGFFYNSLQASRKAYIASVNNLRQTESAILKSTIDLYYAVVLAEENLKIKQESSKLLLENYQTVLTGYNKGIFSRLNYLTAQVEYNNSKTELINAQNDYDTAAAALNIHLGYNVDNKLNINFDPGSFDENEMNEILENEPEFINNMTAEALKNRPELIQKKSLQEANEYSTSAASSVYYWPTFFIRGNYNYSRNFYPEQESPGSTGNPAVDAILPYLQTAPDEDWQKSWSISFGVSYQWGALSPFDPSHARKRQSENRENQSALDIENFTRQIELEVKTDFIRLKSARLAILSQIDNIKTARENYSASLTQFRNGLIDNTALINANLKLLTARTLLIQSIYNYNTAKSQLNIAVGKTILKI
ncbi:MAG: TolC family protein [Spirochaetes bacterium]|nr:TolC family protein [Spirochaetota bacterium]